MLYQHLTIGLYKFLHFGVFDASECGGMKPETLSVFPVPRVRNAHDEKRKHSLFAWQVLKRKVANTFGNVLTRPSGFQHLCWNDALPIPRVNGLFKNMFSETAPWKHFWKRCIPTMEERQSPLTMSTSVIFSTRIFLMFCESIPNSSHWNG